MSIATARPQTCATTVEDERSVVVFDDLSRLSWQQVDTGHWQLREIWPTREQRSEVLKRARRGGTALLVLRDRSESQTAYLDEIPQRLEGHTLDIGAGLVEITVKPGDWLPRAVRSRLEVFVQAEIAARKRTPRLLHAPASLHHDRRANLYFLYVEDSVSRASLEQQLNLIIESLPAPSVRSPKRRLDAHLRRVWAWAR